MQFHEDRLATDSQRCFLVLRKRRHRNNGFKTAGKNLRDHVDKLYRTVPQYNVRHVNAVPHVLGDLRPQLYRVRVRIKPDQPSTLLYSFHSFRRGSEKINGPTEVQHILQRDIVFSAETPDVSTVAYKPPFFTRARQLFHPPSVCLFPFL